MTITEIRRFREVVRIVESGPQSLVNVEFLDKVVIVDVSRIANHKIKILFRLRINKERDELVCEWIETSRR